MNGKHGHVVDYRHVIHSLRRKPMALLGLVYRLMFDHLLDVHGEREACRTTVELLAMADELACEAELAGLLAEDLAARRTPCPTALRARFSLDPADLSDVVVKLVPLSIDDGLIEQGEAA